MRPRGWMGIIALCIAAPACAAILGDDYVIDDGDESDGDGGSGNSGSGCGDKACDACIGCACQSERAACDQSASCIEVLTCVNDCGDDQSCAQGCWENPGADLAIAWFECLCQACPNCGC